MRATGSLQPNHGMPRRKKNGQSPARAPGGSPERGSLGHNRGYSLPAGFDGAMANNFPSSTSLPRSVKEKIVKSMQEMFSHLDPEVIYIVLSECDFKVDNAMDTLLELAEVAAPATSHVSGFERTAAALLSPYHSSGSGPDSSRPSQLPPSPPLPTSLLTEELDLLVDQELQALTARRGVEEERRSSQYLSVGASLSSLPPLPFQQQVLPELLQASLQTGPRGPSGGLAEHFSGTSSPLDRSVWEDESVEQQQSKVDFTHLMTETSECKPKPALDLATSGRPSAFQVYKKLQDPSHALSDKAGVVPSEAMVGGARSKADTLNQEPLGYMSLPWNMQAPVFSPRIHGIQGPVFITPVAQSPSVWSCQPRPTLGPVSRAPLRPAATIPKSWALSAAPHLPAQHSRLRLEGKVLVLLRGAPGSGKSTLARAFLEQNPGGVRLSTDDYFTRHGVYQYDPAALGEAHEWNHKQAKEAFARAANPIIIDNTNMQGWEMKPYVAQALKHGYKVLFREPDTWWKNKPRELEKRTTHSVPVERIRRMLDNCERFVTVQSIMGSRMPEMKPRLLLENNRAQLVTSKTSCPDLVGPPGLAEGCNKSHPQLCSSLPDVSSIGRCREMGMMEEGTHKSTESLNFQPTGTLTENPAMSDGVNDMDLGEFDSELDAQLELNRPIGDQRIPDCIVESVMSEDPRGDDMPVAFSESIAQRVWRERPSRGSGFDRSEPADGEAKEAEGSETARDGGEKGRPQMLDFAGDWPCGGSLEHQRVRKREGHEDGNGKEDEAVCTDADKNIAKVQPGPDVTEFQKRLDLIQTGGADIRTGSSRSSSLSQSSGEELEKEEDEAAVNSTRGELPDCVLDWKAAGSSKVRESRLDGWEGIAREREARRTTGGKDNVLEIVSKSVDLKSTDPTNPNSPLDGDSLVISETVEADVCHDGVVSHNVEGDVGAGLAAGHTDTDRTEDGRETEADGSHISEASESPAWEGSVEAESSAFSGGSQERKQRHGRRSGKQCKLALTFTQNCPAPSQSTLETPNSSAQSGNSIQNSTDTDVEPDCSLKPNFDLSRTDAHPQPPSPLPLAIRGSPTQTDPQDFALLWRLNRRDAVAAACRVTVLSGDSSRFVPELSSAVSAAVAVHPSNQREVPYHVAHEKGTQVEEKELGATQDRLKSLRILSSHFKLVSFDTLEDLHDKCHQDLEWTTNLLLDSGERFFREDDGKEEDGARGGDERNTSGLCGASGKPEGTRLCPNVLVEHFPEGWPQGEPAGFKEESAVSESYESADNTDAAVPVRNIDHPDTKTSQGDPSVPHAASKGEKGGECKATSEAHPECVAWGGSLDDGVIVEESRVEMEEEIASMDEVHRLLLYEMEREEEERTGRRHAEERGSRHLDIQSVELKLPTEVALQLIELFGPVGADPGACSTDEYAVQMDLHLAKLLHQKWKETIQKKQRQATLSFHLLGESSAHWGESQVARPGSRDQTQPTRVSISAEGHASLVNQLEARGQMPFMDHWNAPHPHVSLRNIIKEEQALQENVEKVTRTQTRQSRADLDRRDGAALLNENQLFSLFPTIDRHFLQDIFRDHNYSLTQTELFLSSLLEEEPVKTVVAPEAPRSDHLRAASKEREKKQKPPEAAVPNYQDTEDPEYEDFRAEATQQKGRQLECFSKANEAYKQGRKEVASFYAQQGHLHGQRMREANHRAAVQIFEQVNSSLLPSNILDLHGLHVDEALEHLAQVLQDKTTDCEQCLCRPQLSVITGRGNHSQGGVARIRPAVINYLTNKHYRYIHTHKHTHAHAQHAIVTHLFSYLFISQVH
ncbi:NEDD4-binding protein 2 isoform X3 [Anarrhichthys ocellatus]|uniref:NEDD4-binding protein 2 isoform X3 n=1 Tax=Anarrhichthys ocellatus TaxID=433405 RepID=UPI0012EDA77C|nr:NEDD4-binding protein 2 isoform X3 [Anarrhichthys ocellatus]